MCRRSRGNADHVNHKGVMMGYAFESDERRTTEWHVRNGPGDLLRGSI